MPEKEYYLLIFYSHLFHKNYATLVERKDGQLTYPPNLFGHTTLEAKYIFFGFMPPTVFLLLFLEAGQRSHATVEANTLEEAMAEFRKYVPDTRVVANLKLRLGTIEIPFKIT